MTNARTFLNRPRSIHSIAVSAASLAGEAIAGPFIAAALEMELLRLRFARLDNLRPLEILGELAA